MAYRPRRRGGIAKEVSSFATAFMQGMKLFSDDERGGRSRARDPYSDENLAKGDERLGKTSALGRLFGRGENELTGFDRGRAVLEEKMRIAANRGDAPAYQKYAADRVLLEQQAANPAVGEKWNTPPVPAARPEAPVRSAVPARQGAAPAQAPVNPPAQAPVNPPAQVNPPAAAINPPAPSVQAPVTPDRRTDTFEPAPPGGQAVREELSADGGGDGSENGAPTFREAALNADEIPATETAAYTWNPDQGSIFDRMPDTPDFEMGVDVAQGGMIPTMYAARGASVTDRMGSTGGALNMDEVTNPGARYTGGLEYGTAEGELEEGEEPGSPTMYRPEGPAIEDGEAAGRTANLNLSRDPEELAAAAAPAIAAGMDRIQAELKPSGAISAEDPAYQEKLQKFARGEGRMTDEEIAELDRVVDPDGNLAPSAKSAARLAAIYKFYEDRGEPDTARDVAARVILYDKFASQTRGAMALQALKDGDIDSGVKLLEDAYNNNMPDAKTARADRDDEGLVRINEDGTVNFNLGWDKLTGFQPTQKGRATRQDLIQLASNTATGAEPMQRFMAASGKKAATGAVASKSTDEEVTKGLEAVRAAATALKEARDANDPEAIAQATRELQGAVGSLEQLPVPRMRDGRSDENVRTRRVMQAKNAATSILGTTGRTTSGTGGGTKEERDARAEADRMAALDRREQALRADISSSPIVEQEEVDRIRSGLQAIQLERAGIAAGRAPQRKQFSENFAERTAPINEALNTYLKEVRPEPVSGKADTRKLPDIKGNLRRQFLDTEDRLLATNDINPDTLVRSLYDMTQKLDTTPRLIGDGKGGMVLAVGSERLIVDRDTYRRIAEMRGERLSEVRKGNLQAFTAKQAKAAEERRSTAERRFDVDDQEQRMREQGLLERAIGGTPYGAPVRPTPRGVLNEAARERWRKFNQQNRPSSE
jgi:hypothetical protein